MAKQIDSMVLYYRTRPSEKAASEAAWQQQYEFAQQKREEGYDIVGEFVEAETAEPDYGWTEWRPELRKAMELAVKAQAEHGICCMAFLRMEAIGRGDAFEAPFWMELIRDEVRISCDWGYASPNGDGFKWDEEAHDVAAPPDAPEGLSVYVNVDYADRIAPVYLCNRTAKAVQGLVHHEHHLVMSKRKSTSTTEFMVQPGQCGRFSVFVQGTGWRGEPHFWRFEFSDSRDGEAKMLLVTEDRFKRRWRELVAVTRPRLG